MRSTERERWLPEAAERITPPMVAARQGEPARAGRLQRAIDGPVTRCGLAAQRDVYDLPDC